MSFYVYLPSNSSPKFFKNTFSHFKTKLLKRIENLNDFEVAITELSYSSSLKLDSDIHEISIQFNSSDTPTKVIKREFGLSCVPFADVKDLVTHVQNLIQEHTTSINVWYDSSIGRVKVNTSHNTSLQFGSSLTEYLGLGKRGFFGEGLSIGTKSPTVSNGNYIYIYTDIIKDQIVGDTLSPLLRIVNNTHDKRDLRTVSFKPYYKEVCRAEFDAIDILLCNELGKEIKFYDGPVNLSLHFRPRSSVML